MAITAAAIIGGAVSSLVTYLATKRCCDRESQRLREQIVELQDLVERYREDSKRWQYRAGRERENANQLAAAIATGNTTIIDFAIARHNDFVRQMQTA